MIGLLLELLGLERYPTTPWGYESGYGEFCSWILGSNINALGLELGACRPDQSYEFRFLDLWSQSKVSGLGFF